MSTDPNLPAYVASEIGDLKRARQVPSSFANRAHVRVWGGLTRLTFGERVVPGEPTTWTVAVTLTTQDALELANLIYRQYDQETADLEAAAQAAMDQVKGDLSKGG
ncbi:MAG: hypothetical protein H7124_02430 [Phycisphaerales bacterium]|nr:hypothetical protein [Hyphomonadaceae bacterium]